MGEWEVSGEGEQGIGRVGVEWRMRARDRGSGVGWWRLQRNGISDEEKGEQIDDRYRCQPHPGLQG